MNIAIFLCVAVYLVFGAMLGMVAVRNGGGKDVVKTTTRLVLALTFLWLPLAVIGGINALRNR